MNEQDELDRLYEELISDRQSTEATPAPVIGHGRVHEVWWWQRSFHPIMDIVYYNKEGKLHRIYGPARVSKEFNYDAWYKDGLLHRLDGPALRHRHNEYWLREGKLHRIGGPAIITYGGPKEYWINGQKVPPKEYKKEMKRMNRKGLL